MVSKYVNMTNMLIWIWLDMDSKYVNMNWVWLDMVSKYVNMTEYDLIWFPNMLIWLSMTWYGFQIC